METALAIADRLDACPIQIGDIVWHQPNKQISCGQFRVIGRWIEVQPLAVMLQLHCSVCGDRHEVDASAVTHETVCDGASYYLWAGDVGSGGGG